jgi:ligand-binding sensor domain-containing protein/signal transduction histidine kinase
MFRSINIVFVLLLYAFIPPLSSQDLINSGEKNIIIKSWTVKEGLPSNSIRRIHENPDGRLLVACYHGVSFFDGKNFENFNAENISFLKSSSVYDFVINEQGHIYFASQNGIFVFKENKFSRPAGLEVLSETAVESLCFDKDKRLWIGTVSDGLFCLTEGKLKHITELNELKQSIISLLFSDKTGNTWIGNERGDLFLFDGKKYSKKFQTPGANGIVSALQKKDGSILFGARNGIYIYDEESFQSYSNKINSINDIVLDRKGNLWLASNTGVYYQDPVSNEFIPFTQEPNLYNNIIQTLYFDQNNILWAGSYRKGLFQVRIGPFENYPFQDFEDIPSAIAELENGKLWISTDEGKILELKDHVYKRVPLKTNLDGARIKDIYSDSKKNIWISSYKGLLKLSGQKEYFLDAKTGFPDITFRGVIESEDGNFWVATRQSGLYKINSDFRILKRINTANGLSSNFVMSLISGKNGKIYIATKRGIDVIKNDSITEHLGVHQGLSENLVYHIYEDNQGVLYIATISGLSIYKNGKFIVYNKKRGLIDENIFDVKEDEKGYLWLPTANGMIRIKKSELNRLESPGSVVFPEIYDKSDGMMDPQYVGATRMLKLKNGKIAFNTVSGVTIMNPEIVDLYRNNKVLLFKNLQSEKTSYFFTEKDLELPSTTRYVQINYALIDFINQDKAEFLYKLEPFDKDWQLSGSDRFAKYTNLPPDRYKFTIKAVMKGKGDASYEKSVIFLIKPRFYDTAFFKISSILVLTLFIFFIYKYRLKTIKRQKEQLEYQITERTTEIIKQKEAIEKHLSELEKQKNEIDQKNEEILIATNNMEQAYLNLRLLSDFGKEITSFLHITDICSSFFHYINHLMDSDLVGIGIYEPESSSINFPATFYKGKKQGPIESETNRPHCILSHALLNDLEIISNDIRKDYPEFSSSFPEIQMLMSMASIICIPIRSKRKVTGIITVQSFRKNSYSDYHFSTLKSLAVYIGIAIENSNNYQKLNLQKEELQKVNAAKDKMFSIIGHDLRGPVGTIKSFLDLLIENPELTNTDETLTILKNMQLSLGSAYTLLDNLLLWAKNQRGNIEFNPQAFDLTEPVNESINLVIESSKSKNIHIEPIITCQDEVIADQLMITTVLRNLISNAIKFTPVNGKITVLIQKVQDQMNGENHEMVELKVIDNGVGIKDEDIEKILNPNELFTTQGTDKEQGSGLGISICVDFLNRHKKKLRIERNQNGDGVPQNGTTFSFLLDLAEKD